LKDEPQVRTSWLNAPRSLNTATPGEAAQMGPDTDSSCGDELPKFLNQRGDKSAKSLSHTLLALLALPHSGDFKSVPGGAKILFMVKRSSTRRRSLSSPKPSWWRRRISALRSRAAGRASKKRCRATLRPSRGPSSDRRRGSTESVRPGSPVLARARAECARYLCSCGRAAARPSGQAPGPSSSAG
jgi:hypothetical protein